MEARKGKRHKATAKLNLFEGTNEMMQYARDFLNKQSASLRVYVERSLKESETLGSPPPFPALLYSLAVIDLLGALYAGNAASHADYSKQAKDYIVNVMGWDDERAKILRILFRHKLAHLAAPAPVVVFGNKRISWRISESDVPHHFMLERLPKRESWPLFGAQKLEFDYRFGVSLMALFWDIDASIGKYLDALRESQSLQVKFETAIAQIFELQ